MTTKQDAMEVAELTDEQRMALIACVDALSWFAGEGYAIAEDAIYDLAVSFNMEDSLTYEEWVRLMLAARPTNGDS